MPGGYESEYVGDPLNLVASSENTEAQAIEDRVHSDTGVGKNNYPEFSSTAHDYLTPFSQHITRGEIDPKIADKIAKAAPTCDYIPGGVKGRDKQKYSACNNPATHLAYLSDKDDAGDILSSGLDHRAYLVCKEHSKQAAEDLMSEPSLAVRKSLDEQHDSGKISMGSYVDKLRDSIGNFAGRIVSIDDLTKKRNRSVVGNLLETVSRNNKIKTFFKFNPKAREEVLGAPTVLPRQVAAETTRVLESSSQGQLPWIEDVNADEARKRARSIERARLRAEARTRIEAGEDIDTVSSELSQTINPQPPQDPDYVKPKRRVGRPVREAGLGEADVTAYSIIKNFAPIAVPLKDVTEDTEEKGLRGTRAMSGFTRLYEMMKGQSEQEAQAGETQTEGEIYKPSSPESKLVMAMGSGDVGLPTFTPARTKGPREDFRPSERPPEDDQLMHSSLPLRQLAYSAMLAPETGARPRPEDRRFPWRSDMSPEEAYNARMTIKTSPDGKGTPLIWDHATNTARVVEISQAAGRPEGQMIYRPTATEFRMPFANDEIHDPNDPQSPTKNYMLFRNLPELGSTKASLVTYPLQYDPSEPTPGRLYELGEGKIFDKDRGFTEPFQDSKTGKWYRKNTETDEIEETADPTKRAFRRPFSLETSRQLQPTAVGEEAVPESSNWDNDTIRNRQKTLLAALASANKFWAPAPTLSPKKGRTRKEVEPHPDDIPHMSDEDFQLFSHVAAQSKYFELMDEVGPEEFVKQVPEEDRGWLLLLSRESSRRVRVSERLLKQELNSRSARRQDTGTATGGEVTVLTPGTKEYDDYLAQKKASEDRKAAEKAAFEEAVATNAAARKAREEAEDAAVLSRDEQQAELDKKRKKSRKSNKGRQQT